MSLPFDLHAPSPLVRVLLVEDEPKLRESLAEGLRLEAWDVATAGNGAEAVRLLHAQPFDLLLLDWMLPDLDGMDILRRARQHAPHLPVLMMTARCSHFDQITAFRQGVSDFLTKPFSFDDLLARSRSLVPSAVRASVSPP